MPRGPEVVGRVQNFHPLPEEGLAGTCSRRRLLLSQDPEAQPGPPRRGGPQQALGCGRESPGETRNCRMGAKTAPRGFPETLSQQRTGPREGFRVPAVGGSNWGDGVAAGIETFSLGLGGPHEDFFWGVGWGLAPWAHILTPGLHPGDTVSPAPQELRPKRTDAGPMPAFGGKLETPPQLEAVRGCGMPGLALPTPLPLPRPSVSSPSREVKVLSLGRGCPDSGVSLGMQSREEGTGE